MSTTDTRPHDEIPTQWEQARRRSSAELLAVLAPTADEPRAIQRTAVWKTGPILPPASGGAA